MLPSNGSSVFQTLQRSNDTVVLDAEEFSLRKCLLNLSSLLTEIHSRQSSNASPHEEVKHSPHEQQPQALVYIVVVLLFYSLSIVILMVKYIRRQRRQWEEEKMLKEILQRARQLTLWESKYMTAQQIEKRLQSEKLLQGSNKPPPPAPPPTSDEVPHKVTTV